MDQYFKNLVHRLKYHSKALNQKEVFVDKPWFYIDEKERMHEYIFMRDKRLIMSLNGQVVTGSWELLPNEKLLIDRVNDKILLENMFIDDALMILKMSSTTDDPFILINKNRVPDLDAIRYLNDKAESEDPKGIPNDPTKIMVLKNGTVRGLNFYVGAMVESYDGSIVTGSFRVVDVTEEKYITVEQGILKSIFYHIYYTFGETDNKELILKQKYIEPQVGDTIINHKDIILPLNETNKVKNKNGSTYIFKFSTDGKLTMVKETNYAIIIMLFLLGIIFISIIIAMITL